MNLAKNIRMSKQSNKVLQAMCRDYLRKLRHVAKKYGLDNFIDNTIELNRNDECRGTQEEVEMLSRLCDDERVSRVDIPIIMGKSYRQCNEDGTFDNIKKLRHVGIYSKVDAMIKTKKQC